MSACLVCSRPIPAGSRSHRTTCSPRCRQAFHRQSSPTARTKDAARTVVQKALQSGALTRGPCAACGAQSVEAHHPNGYEGPAALDVTFLCRAHHADAHRGHAAHPGRAA